MVAGVFGRCMFFKNTGDGHTPNCCADPVVYERITSDMRNWIWKKAPGVRDTKGCRKNQIKSMSSKIFLKILK